jgi:Flp pilus assembly protein TadG
MNVSRSVKFSPSLRGGRPAAATVEGALVFPLVVFLVLALLVGAVGIFRYQEVCYLAHEGARYASVHGTDYQSDMQKPAATPQDVYNNAILPRVMMINPSSLNYTVTWNSSNAPASITSSYANPVRNTVTVTVTYTWLPELYLVGPYTLTGTSTLPMTY